MVQATDESVDPRIRRTRQLLQQSLDKLLQKREFDEISVGDITDKATLNRATFYDHYPDKFALLECLVGTRFNELLAERDVQFDGSCGSALKVTIMAVCEYLTRLQGPGRKRHLQPHMELAIISVVRRMLLQGLKQNLLKSTLTPELKAAIVSSAVSGAAKEWTQTADPASLDEFANLVAATLTPILHAA